MTTDNSRADALTDEYYKQVWKRVNGTHPDNGVFGRMVVDFARALRPVEQHEAAPDAEWDEECLCALHIQGGGRDYWTLGKGFPGHWMTRDDAGWNGPVRYVVQAIPLSDAIESVCESIEIQHEAAPATSDKWAAYPVARRALASSIEEVETLSNSEDRDLTVSETESMMLVLHELRRLQVIEREAVEIVARAAAPLEGTGNGADERDIRIAQLEESVKKWQALAESNQRLAEIAQARADRYATRAPRTEVAGAVAPVENSPAYALRGLYKPATEYFIDGKPCTPDEYISWQAGIIEAVTKAKLPDPKYYGGSAEDGDQHEVRCAYVDGWNDCRASILATPSADAAATCETCNGRGEVGGFQVTGFGEGGYDAEPCPACSADAAAEDKYVIERLSTVLAGVAAALLGEEADRPAAETLQKLPEEAAKLRLELDLYRAQAADAAAAPADGTLQRDRLLAALERATKAESALRALVDECDNDTTAGWEDRMRIRIDDANRLLAATAAAAAAPADAQKTIPKWIFDNLVATLSPAWDYIQTHQDQFDAKPGDDKTKILVDEFLHHAYRTAGLADERALPQIPDLVKSMAWLTVCLRTELSRLDDNTHKALDEVEAQLCCVRAITNGAIDYEAMVARAAASKPAANPPFENCQFRACDLPGQCRSEGACHHPKPAAAAGQEAVAWYVTWPGDPKETWCSVFVNERDALQSASNHDGAEVPPLYTAPPAQVATRHGLTDARIIEIAEIIGISDVVTDDRLVKFVRALLEGAKQ
ncbi:hypothetical protein [Burkholderia stabilis]